MSKENKNKKQESNSEKTKKYKLSLIRENFTNSRGSEKLTSPIRTMKNMNKKLDSGSSSENDDNLIRIDNSENHLGDEESVKNNKNKDNIKLGI